MTITLDPTNPASLTNTALAADQTTLNGNIAALTLAQAIASKTGFVGAIFNGKRQIPIAFTVGAGAFSWDATDEAVNALSQAAINALLAGLNLAIDTLGSGLIAEANIAFSTAATGVNTALATLTSNINTVLTALIGDVNAQSAFPLAVLSHSLGSAPTVTAPTIAPVPAIGNVSWTPLGQSAPVTLSGSEVTGLLNAIAARRASLKQTQLTLAAGLAACANVAAVQALDVTSAWAS